MNRHTPVAYVKLRKSAQESVKEEVRTFGAWEALAVTALAAGAIGIGLRAITEFFTPSIDDIRRKRQKIQSKFEQPEPAWVIDSSQQEKTAGFYGRHVKHAAQAQSQPPSQPAPAKPAAKEDKKVTYEYDLSYVDSLLIGGVAAFALYGGYRLANYFINDIESARAEEARRKARMRLYAALNAPAVEPPSMNTKVAAFGLGTVDTLISLGMAVLGFGAAAVMIDAYEKATRRMYGTDDGHMTLQAIEDEIGRPPKFLNVYGSRLPA